MPTDVRADRRAPTLPWTTGAGTGAGGGGSPGRPTRVLIDADAANEVDDQYALALALLNPGRINLRGVVAAHFGDKGGPSGISQSYAEIVRVLERAGMADGVPVLRGSPPLLYSSEPQPSEGVDFILEEARRASPDDPLWLVGLGPATDIVSAYLLDPSIVDRVVILYHGRTQWPLRCWNFNTYNDVRAARALFHSALPLVLFDTGTYLRQGLPEAVRRVAPHGPLGRYLYEIRSGDARWAAADKGLFDLGDIALLVEPALCEWEEVAVPSVGWDLAYDHSRTHGRMLRVYHVSRDGTFDLLSRTLERHATR